MSRQLGAMEDTGIITTLHARVAELENALAFYANKENWEDESTHWGDPYWCKALEDNGATARRTMKGLQFGTCEQCGAETEMYGDVLCKNCDEKDMQESLRRGWA